MLRPGIKKTLQDHGNGKKTRGEKKSPEEEKGKQARGEDGGLFKKKGEGRHDAGGITFYN